MYKEIGHSELWRDNLAVELNILIEHSKTQGKKVKQALQSIVERVANFEEVEEK